MKKAQITAEHGYKYAIDGVHVKVFKKGSIVHGRIAEKALEDKAAKKVSGKKTPKPEITKPLDGPEQEG